MLWADTYSCIPYLTYATINLVAGKCNNLPGGNIMDAQELEKRINLMRYWLFGLFAIVFAGFSVYFGMFFGTALLKMPQYWIAVGVTAVICVAAFYLYKWYLGRK